MSRFAIPEKIYFKIGEVCDLVGVQAHVLRYWETEFPMLAPQKNRAGQRTYRRRDVEIALRIKELLYEELYTIAGAKKKLSSELRETPKLKVVPNEPTREEPSRDFVEEIIPEKPAVQAFPQRQDVNNFAESDDDFDTDFEEPEFSAEHRAALKNLALQLSELRQILEVEEEVPRRGW
jgi:DNA-binding transcriptional MerR regulator